MRSFIVGEEVWVFGYSQDHSEPVHAKGVVTAIVSRSTNYSIDGYSNGNRSPHQIVCPRVKFEYKTFDGLTSVAESSFHPMQVYKVKRNRQTTGVANEVS